MRQNLGSLARRRQGDLGPYTGGNETLHVASSRDAATLLRVTDRIGDMSGNLGQTDTERTSLAG